MTTTLELDGHLETGVITAKEYQAIHLHDVKHLSYLQIGLALGIARQTVHERARRGHEKIKRAERTAA